MDFTFWPLTSRLVPWRVVSDDDGGRSSRVALNVWVDEQAVHVEAELPGVAEDALEITIDDDELTLSGRRDPDLGEAARVLRRERPTGEFRRVVGLPFPVAADEVSAALEHGVLSLTLPKAASARPRTIKVTASSEETT